MERLRARETQRECSLSPTFLFLFLYPRVFAAEQVTAGFVTERLILATRFVTDLSLLVSLLRFSPPSSVLSFHAVLRFFQAAQGLGQGNARRDACLISLRVDGAEDGARIARIGHEELVVHREHSNASRACVR